jgi:hypothetical protein
VCAKKHPHQTECDFGTNIPLVYVIVAVESPPQGFIGKKGLHITFTEVAEKFKIFKRRASYPALK